jgi:hypothetical protein
VCGEIIEVPWAALGLPDPSAELHAVLSLFGIDEKILPVCSPYRAGSGYCM